LGAVLLDLVLPAFGGERGGQELKGVGVHGIGMGIGMGIGIRIGIGIGGGGGGGGGGGSIITLHGGYVQPIMLRGLAGFAALAAGFFGGGFGGQFGEIFGMQGGAIC